MFKILKDKRISVLPYVIGASVSYLIGSMASLAIMYFNKTLVSYAEGTIENLSPMTLVLFVLAVIFIQMVITNIFVNYLISKLTLKNYNHIVNSIFKKSISMFIPDYEKIDKGKVINHYLVDAPKAGDSVIQVIGAGIGLLITILVMLIISFNTSFKVTLYSLVMFLPFIFITEYGAKKLEETSTDFAKENDFAISKIKNYCMNKESIALSNQDSYFISDFNESMDNLRDKKIKNVFWQKVAYEMPTVIIGLTPIVILLIATTVVKDDSLRFSQIYFISSLMISIYEPLGQLVVLLTKWKESKPYIKRLLEFLDTDSKAEESLNNIFSGDKGFLKGSADMYGIDGRELYKFDLELPDKGFFVFKGPNGSGKSTFFKLLSQMMDPTLLRDSDLKINGKYRNDIGVLFYPLFVFSGTVEENINFGKKIDDNLIDLFNLPDLQKQVVPDPINLSSGETQKIALLRLLGQEKDVYLLDEPTSNLEKEAVLALKDYIQRIKEDKLVIAIMHDDRYDSIADGFINIEDCHMQLSKSELA